MVMAATVEALMVGSSGKRRSKIHTLCVRYSRRNYGRGATAKRSMKQWLDDHTNFANGDRTLILESKALFKIEKSCSESLPMKDAEHELTLIPS
ncbi:hypothetical protein F0562_015516 [Nyssa sinensis]|uniref:Uncharacterized protein n=1 Tax=Nyssa sinensis TaxID=561372 RepID=A0A5J4ZJT2_9ASTE|nr:hypothetical protein F0562_015516 [Nyssa sinensis]